MLDGLGGLDELDFLRAEADAFGKRVLDDVTAFHDQVVGFLRQPAAQEVVKGRSEPDVPVEERGVRNQLRAQLVVVQQQELGAGKARLERAQQGGNLDDIPEAAQAEDEDERALFR